MGFKYNSVVRFNGDTDTGLDKVALGSIIQVTIGGVEKLLQYKDITGVTAGTTIAAAVTGSNLEEVGKALTIDSIPTNGSTNPVSSDGVFDSVDTVASNLSTLDGTVSTLSGTVSTLSSTVTDGLDGKADVIDGSLRAYGNTQSITNTACGRGALNNGTSVNSTVAVGDLALYFITTGTENVAIGKAAMQFSNTASYCVAIGADALDNSNHTGDKNTIIGNNAGRIITTGTNNTCIGNSSEPATATTSGSVTLGDNLINSLRCNVQTISSLSDERDKTNIEDSDIGLDFVNTLRPVEFDWDRRDGSMTEAGRQLGFIAQEIDEASADIPSIRNTGLISTENPDRLEMGQSALIPALVKAIQDLSDKIELQNAEIELLKASQLA